VFVFKWVVFHALDAARLASRMLSNLAKHTTLWEVKAITKYKEETQLDGDALAAWNDGRPPPDKMLHVAREQQRNAQ
jgi:hypothetical protein